MNRRRLREQKLETKILPGNDVIFDRGHKLPRPLNQIVRSSRAQTTKLIKVSDRHSVCFLYRDGDVRVRSAFYGWLLYSSGKQYTAVASLHYHPSHKPPHIHTPCEEPEDKDFGTLHECKQLNLNEPEPLIDPRTEQGRLKLIQIFCRATGIVIKKDNGNDTAANKELDLRPV